MKSVLYKVDAIYKVTGRGQIVVLKETPEELKLGKQGFLWHKDKGLKFTVTGIEKAIHSKPVGLILRTTPSILEMFGENEDKLVLEFI